MTKTENFYFYNAMSSTAHCLEGFLQPIPQTQHFPWGLIVSSHVVFFASSTDKLGIMKVLHGLVLRSPELINPNTH